MKTKLSLIILVCVIVLSACSSNDDEHSSMTHDMESHDWSHLEELGADAATIEAYDFAVKHPEVLDYIPCYCGCHHDAGHESNTDCFVDQVEDNVAILDNMGLG